MGTANHGLYTTCISYSLGRPSTRKEATLLLQDHAVPLSVKHYKTKQQDVLIVADACT